MKVIVSGGNGQVGQALKKTVPANVDCHFLGRQEFNLTDAGQIRSVLTNIQPSLVINAAAYTAVDRAESEPDGAFAVNATGAGELAQACADHGIRLIHISTDYVFDGQTPIPRKPQDPVSPKGVYGDSKAAGEKAVTEIHPDALIVRTAWVYGLEGDNFVKTMLRLLAEREQVDVVMDQIGTPTWAADLACALWQFANKMTSGIYHFTDAGIASWYDLAVAISEEARSKGLLFCPGRVVPTKSSAFPRPAPRPAYSVLDCEATYSYLRRPPIHWRVALRAMLNDYQTAVVGGRVESST